MSLFFFQTMCKRCVKVPEWQEEKIAANGKNRHYIGAKKSYSQGAAPKPVVIQRKKMSHGAGEGRWLVYAEDDGEGNGQYFQ